MGQEITHKGVKYILMGKSLNNLTLTLYCPETREYIHLPESEYWGAKEAAR